MFDAIVTQASNLPERPVDFSYYSTHRCVIASGIFERISQPAQTDGDNGQSLWQKIQATIARARAQGVSAPLVVGAIPFDTRRPSCLFIPQYYHFSLRQADASLASCNCVSPTATITHVNSMPDARYLRPLCRQLITPSSPSLLATNIMWHLSSPIEGELYQTDNSVVLLACLLHPHPAMCGTPTAAVRELIAELRTLRPRIIQRYCGMERRTRRR